MYVLVGSRFSDNLLRLLKLINILGSPYLAGSGALVLKVRWKHKHYSWGKVEPRVSLIQVLLDREGPQGTLSKERFDKERAIDLKNANCLNNPDIQDEAWRVLLMFSPF